MYLPLPLHRWHVWYYVHRSIQHLFTRQMFSVRARHHGQHYSFCWLKFTCVWYFSKQFTTHRPTSHFLQKYVLLVCFCSENTRHCCCFPLEGQCCECFTSSRLSWDSLGLGLPREVPLAVTFPSCEWIINLRMRISWKFLCVIWPPHDLCIRNAFRMVMSVRWENSSLVHFHVLRAIP